MHRGIDGLQRHIRRPQMVIDIVGVGGDYPVGIGTVQQITAYRSRTW